MSKKEKAFRDCTLTFLEDTFGLEEVLTLPSLETWLKAPFEITAFEKQNLENLRDLLNFNVYDWNEQELDMNFIGPMFSLVNFSSKKYNLFAGREIEGKVKDWKLAGAPDNMVASGRRKPKIPFFAFQEYKRKKDPKGDPAGQALAAMLVGQVLNKDKRPIYGCFVIGNDWHFITLEGEKFAKSRDYSGLSDEIFDIFRMLKVLKQKVIQFTSS